MKNVNTENVSTLRELNFASSASFGRFPEKKVPIFTILSSNYIVWLRVD